MLTECYQGGWGSKNPNFMLTLYVRLPLCTKSLKTHGLINILVLSVQIHITQQIKAFPVFYYVQVYASVWGSLGVKAYVY